MRDHPVPSRGGSTRVAFFPDFSAGNPYQRLLAEALRARGFEVKLGELRRQLFPFLGFTQRNSTEVLHFHWVDPFFLDRRSTLMAAKALRSLVDVALLRAKRVRVVWTVHNSISHESPHPRLERIVLSALARLPNALIVHCEAARTEAIAVYRLGRRVRSKIHVIPMGNYDGCYPPPDDGASARRRLALDGHERILLCFGLIRRYKGIMELVNAFRASAPAGWSLLVVGRADNLQAGKLLAAVDHDPRVVIRLGFVSEDAVADYLTVCDAVALPYNRIMLASAAVLALTMGRAVLASRVGCMTEVLDDAGAIWFEPGDPQDMARALQELVSRDLVAMGNHNRRLAERMRWSDVAEATARAYDALPLGSADVREYH